MNRSVMWCDWSSSATDVRHACCSERQLLNSGVTGKTVGRACALRSSATGLPARAMACASDSGMRTPSFLMPSMLCTQAYRAYDSA